MIKTPQCLHIPVLYEDEIIMPSWAIADGCDYYELDRSYDQTFEDASRGRVWADFDGMESPWSAQQEKEFSWNDVEQLNTRGLSWEDIEFSEPAWQTAEDEPISWREIQSQSIKFTVYSGKGIPCPPPGSGMEWGNTDSLAKSWEDAEDWVQSWLQIESVPAVGLNWGQWQVDIVDWQQAEDTIQTWNDVHFQLERAYTWDSINAHFLSAAQMEALGCDWHAIEYASPHKTPHACCILPVHIGKKKAYFRLRAIRSGDSSPYLSSSKQEIIPVFYREGAIELTLDKGQSYLVQVCGQAIPRFGKIPIILQYDKKYLMFDRIMDNAVGLTHTATAELKARGNGELHFMCGKEIAGETEWSGTTMLLQFTAAQTGTTTLWIR